MTELPGIYAGKQWNSHVTNGAYTYRYAAVGDEFLTFRRSQMTGFIRGEIPPGDDYVVQWIDAGSSVVDVGDTDVPQALHRPMLFPPHREFVFTFTDYDQRLVHLNRALVHGVLAERYDLNTTGPYFDSVPVPSDDAIRQWRQTLAAASQVLRDADVSSLLWHEATRETAVAFVRMYPPRANEIPPALSYPRNARIRTAVDHIHAHAHEPVTISELAAIAGLSVRGLQDGFQRLLGTAPLAYMRQVRLDRVRDELLQRDPDTATVADIAHRWGFMHLGRFSGYYVQQHGEYPRETLRRYGRE